MKLDEI